MQEHRYSAKRSAAIREKDNKATDPASEILASQLNGETKFPNGRSLTEI